MRYALLFRCFSLEVLVVMLSHSFFSPETPALNLRFVPFGPPVSLPPACVVLSLALRVSPRFFLLLKGDVAGKPAFFLPFL